MWAIVHLVLLVIGYLAKASEPCKCDELKVRLNSLEQPGKHFVRRTFRRSQFDFYSDWWQVSDSWSCSEQCICNEITKSVECLLDIDRMGFMPRDVERITLTGNWERSIPMPFKTFYGLRELFEL